MRDGDAKGLASLLGLGARGITHLVQDTHAAVNERTYGVLRRTVGPAVTPVQRVQEGSTKAVYQAVKLGLGAGFLVAGSVAAARVRERGRSADEAPLADGPIASRALAAVNTMYGDHLDQLGHPLVFGMTVRVAGRDVPLNRNAIADAFPQAGPRVAVFAHGLLETEDSWRWGAMKHVGDPEATYGSLLERDLGITPVFLRYNTGLRISRNGAELGALLGALVAVWPVPLEELILIGHSMGGLVAHSALAQTGHEPWAARVTTTVSLGSPHLGAPLERGAGQAAAFMAGSVPELRWLTGLLQSRSPGIRDLAYGNLVQSDWYGHDPDDLANHRTEVGRHLGARHFLVAGTIAPTPEHPLGRWIGDGMVSLYSARAGIARDSGDRDVRPATDDLIEALPDGLVEELTGHAAPDAHGEIPAEPHDVVFDVGRVGHLALVNNPEIYARLRSWLDLDNRPAEPERAH